MVDNLTISILITLLGMGLVFAVILLLWGVIALVVRIGTGREKAVDIQLEDQEIQRQQAVAIAVATALSMKGTPDWQEFPYPPTAVVSPWQAVMRTKMLNKRGANR